MTTEQCALRCSWLRPGDVLTAEFPLRLYELEFPSHTDFSRLVQQRRAHPHSSLEALRVIYQRHGAPCAPLADEVQEESRPITALPSLAHCSVYQLLALRADDVEQFVRAHLDPQWTLWPLLHALAGPCDVERTFPSQRHELCNRLVRRSFARQAPRPLRLDETDEALLADNEVLVRALQHHEAAPPVPRHAREQWQRREEAQDDARTYSRLVPLALLPLVLHALPDAYQRVNNTVHCCQALEAAVLRQICLEAFPGYVRAQLEVMRANCAHLAALYQQAYFARAQERSADDYETELGDLRALHALELQNVRAIALKAVRRAKKRRACDDGS